MSAFALTLFEGRHSLTLFPHFFGSGLDVTIRWVIVPKGGVTGDDFSDLTGTHYFAFDSTAPQTITITPPYDNFEIQIYQIVSDGDDILIINQDIMLADESARKASATPPPPRETAVTKASGDNDLDLSGKTAGQEIITDDGQDAIIDGQGDDYIETGRGDDTIALSTGGDDVVAYNFESESDAFMAVDGNNRVTDFTRGADIIMFKTDAEERAITTLNAFLKDGQGAADDNFADDKFIVTIDYEIAAGPEGGAAYVMIFTGITFHFRESTVYGGNKLSMPLFNIKFAAPMTADELFAVSGGYENLDAGRGVALKKLVELDDAGEVTTNYIASILGTDSIDFKVESLILTGDAGDNVLTGAAGDDTLSGLGGDDTLYGGAGDDTLYGGDDNDRLEGGAGDDTLYGGAGDDTLHGDTDNDTLYGGAGNDMLWGGAGDNTLNGDADNDTLYGDADNDTLNGGVGDDELYGRAGSDILDGGAGTDTAVFEHSSATTDLTLDLSDATRWKQNADGTWVSGTGAEYTFSRLVADGETDYFKNIEHFVIYGGAGNDALTGGAGDDFMLGGGGNDTLYGGAGDDVLFDSNGGNDILWGEAGDDTLNGYADNDTLYGGADNDRLWGGAGNDMLWGGADNDKLYGGAGNDMLWGEAGDDWLYGGDNDDYLGGGAGNDILDGGAGNDTAVFDYSAATANLTLDVADTTRWKRDGTSAQMDATDYADYEYQRFVADISAAGDGTDIETDYFTNIENFEINAGSGNDVLTSGAGNDRLDGGIGNDIFDGGGGIDRLYGGAGDDTLFGGAGNDWLYGGDNDDKLYGGDNDDYLGGDGGNDILDGGAGNDRAWFGYGSATADLTLDLSGATRWKQNNDGTWGSGTSAEYEYQRFVADDETDYFKNIEHFGIFAGSGNDVLTGGSGKDWLDGQSGNNTLSGGGDTDLFVLNLGGTSNDLDTVTDFHHGDKIRVDTSNGNESSLAALKTAANIYWTNNSSYIPRGGTDTSPTNARNIRDTIIYNVGRDGRANTGDDIILMVLEDYNSPLTIADFDIF